MGSLAQVAEERGRRPCIHQACVHDAAMLTKHVLVPQDWDTGEGGAQTKLAEERVVDAINVEIDERGVLFAAAMMDF